LVIKAALNFGAAFFWLSQMLGPNPDNPPPLSGTDQLVFLKNFITRNTISVGDYTYYDDTEHAK